MNCRRVQKLIPLYVEGDLQSPAASRIASHLDWCGRCNWLVDEFKESQSWLHSAAPPEFDEAYLNDLKRSVLTRVEEVRLRPSHFANLLQHWRRRQLLALSTAMLIVVGVFVFYFYQLRMSAPPATPKIAEQSPSNEPTGTDGQALADDKEKAPAAVHRKRYHQATNRTRIARRDVIVAMPAAEQSLLPHTNVAEQPAIESPVDSPDMLRIEIRTSDPNIRIIWFAPREGEGPSRPTTETN